MWEESSGEFKKHLIFGILLSRVKSKIGSGMRNI